MPRAISLDSFLKIKKFSEKIEFDFGVFNSK